MQVFTTEIGDQIFQESGGKFTIVYVDGALIPWQLISLPDCKIVQKSILKFSLIASVKRMIANAE